MSASLYPAVQAAIAETDPEAKAAAATALWTQWQRGELNAGHGWSAPATTPGRPARPELVHPQQLSHRKLGSPGGRAALIHAIAHIEFNAINLALDHAARFAGMPADYYADWLRVAAEEALHFRLLRQHLHTLDADYGDFPAHNALWEMAERTADDVLARMALVPRLLEARGLDVTPGMQARLLAAGDTQAAAILDIIFRDEVGHVAVGNRWFRHLCHERNLDPVAEFRRLLRRYRAPRQIGELNIEARLRAGFETSELDALRDYSVNG
ncbi:ferritin-like domain-containing protein [Chitinimonas sp. BJYL2]|uniref:ferritin-like domain-containing protein n=1 Tax=Chitinimonas sp. BJYL2 TaxID=2976696 RepID=UPI0022B44D12|nr:ferritin-like domain-containing protein [Chitinimonas sp. BJYL2]